MPQTLDAPPAHSLAEVRPGETVEIRSILFDSLRALCRELGLLEGAVVACHAEGRAHLLLRTASGQTICLERDWARFIRVAAVTPGPTRVAAGERVNGARAPAGVSSIQLRPAAAVRAEDDRPRRC